MTEDIAAASRAWPELDPDELRAHLAGLPQWDPARLIDLALAYAAGRGVEAAVRALTTRIETPLRSAIVRAGYPRAVADDATQETLILLLVGGDHRQPTLHSYQGRAPLEAWAKTIGLRLAGQLHAALRDAEQRGREAGGEPDLGPVHDLVASSIRKELCAAVQRAFREAVATLSMFDRELLRAAFVDGEAIDQLARRHDIHRATAARWLGKARRALDEALRAELGRDLAITETEVSSVLRAVHTSLVLPIEPLDR
ncbi:MAG: polymerase Sigma-70 Factor [Deltaproteobacteria bacterium]|nr:polymerase Sigma-70 Factor [Deltaproteobacteria bacterium]